MRTAREVIRRRLTDGGTSKALPCKVLAGDSVGAGLSPARFILTKQGGQTGMAKKHSAYKKALLLFFTTLLTVPFLTQALAADKKVAVLPLALYADPGKAYLRQGIMSMLASRLPGEGLEVLGGHALAPLLREGEANNGITSPERAGELAGLLKADYAVFGSITGTGTGYSLDLSILDRTKEEVRVTNVSEAVTEDQLIPKMADVAYDFRAIIAGLDIREFRKPEAEKEAGGAGLFFSRTAESFGFKPSGRISLKMAVMSMDVGDLSGDGKEEMVVLGRNALSVYTRTEQSLVLSGTLDAARGEEFLKVSVGDMDNNGRAEIYLVSLYGSRAQSSVWEWTGRFSKKLDRQTGHFHVVRNLGGGRSMLIYQNSSVGRFYSGKIYTMAYDQDRLVRKDPLPELKGAQFYTLCLYDFDRNGEADFLGLGEASLIEESFIHVWDTEGNILAKGNEPVGGTNNAIRHGDADPDDQSPRISFNSGLGAMDVDKDGQKEIVAVANNPMTRRLDFWLYLDGNVVAFKPEGGNLVQAYKSGKINYCLTDLRVSGERLYISAQEGQVATFSEGAGRIMWFE